MSRWLLRDAAKVKIKIKIKAKVKVVVAVIVIGIVTVPVGATWAGAEPPPPPTNVPSASTVVENVFVPADQDLTECISAVPEPGCGSKARGGWRQTLVFIVVLIGLAVIAWRITRSVRRRDRPDETRTYEQVEET